MLSTWHNRSTDTLRKRLRKMTNRLLVTLLFTTSYLISMGQVADFIHDFDPSASNSCAPLSVSFTNQSTGATSYAWTINGVAFSTSESPSRTFAQGGAYNVCLEANGVGGNQSCQVLNINEPADIQITNTPTANCAPFSTTINITSNENIVNAVVDFGDGTITSINPTSNNFTASHTYTQEGTFSVVVSAEDDNGCYSTALSSDLVTIRNVKDLGFSVLLSACQIPLNGTFTNTSANPGNYRFDWGFGDGTTGTNTLNATHFYNLTGKYDVTLTATDLLTGCTDDYVIEDAINSESVTSIIATEVDNGDCGVKEINFSLDNFPPNAEVVWDFGDNFMSSGAATTHQYNAVGCFTPKATITTTSGCVFDITATCIQSIGAIDPSFTLIGDLETCNPVTGTTVQHNSNSTKAVDWLWDFGDVPTTSSLENPSHTYQGNGIFQPTLTTTYADGCEQIYTDPTKTVTIQDPTIQIYTDTTRGCIPFNVMFGVQGSNDPILSIDWTFGTGAIPSTITDNEPNVAFMNVGDYDVTAVVKTASGCEFTIVRPGLIEAGDIPVVNFEIDTLASCVDTPLEFTDLSTPAGSVDEWEWDFGDGGTSIDQNPTHEYSEADSFQVSLKAWYNGCPEEFLDTTYIQIGQPKSKFSWKLNCDYLNTVEFTDLSSGADEIWWDFGHGSPISTSTNPTHLFPSEGVYTVTQFTKNNTTGCVDDEVVVIDLKNPVALFDLRDTSFCLNSIVTIKNLSENIFNITWKIDGRTPGAANGFEVINAGSNGADAQIRFTQPITFSNFELTYSIAPGCFADRTITYNNSVQVNYIYPNFIPTVEDCFPATLSLDNSSTNSIPGGDPSLQYHWQVDSKNNGYQQLTGSNPTFILDQIDTYEVNLYVTNDAGCSTGVAVPYTLVLDTIDIGFSWDRISCNTKEVSFINESKSPAATYEWDFGDGKPVSNAPSTSHLYDNNGDYDVTLTITTATGCSKTLTKTIQIYDPTADFAGDNLSKSCPVPALHTNFTNNSDGAISYEWNFGDGGTSTLESPSHQFGVIDTFDITLIATSVNGCTDTLTKLDYIEVGGPFAEMEYSATQTCTGSEIQFIVKGAGVTDYIWDFGNGDSYSSVPTSANDTITYAYPVPGKFQPVLTAQDVSGCKIPYVGVDSINVFDLTIDFTADVLAMCSNDLMDVNFTSQISSGSAIDSIRWLFPGSDTPTAIGTDVSGVSYTTSDQYDVTMIAYTDVCVDTLIKTAYIEVFDPPTFTAPRDTAICINSSIQFEITDNPSLTYSWDNSGSLSCDDCPDPVANPTSTTVYTITGTSPGGCSTTRSFTLTVDQLNAAEIQNPMVSLCIGDDYPLTIRPDANNLVWTTTTQTLKCTDCNDQVITVDGSGTVDVSYDYLSCRITETLIIDAWNPDDIDESANTRSICPGDPVNLERPAYPGTVEIRVADINSAPLTGTSYTPTANSRFYVTVMHHGCTVVDSFDISIDQPNIVTSGPQTICLGDTIRITADGGVGYSYVWDNGATLSCDDCPDPLAFPTTTTTYQVTGDNGNGCTADATITITVNDNVTSDELPDTIDVCLGAVETLTLPASLSNVNWTSTLELTQATGLTTDVTASASDYVQVEYVKDFCTITESIFINVWDPVVEAGNDTMICAGAEFVLPTNYPGTIEWREGSQTATPIVGDRVSPTAQTRYYLKVTNHGCDAVDSLDIMIDQPSITVSGDKTICIGESEQLTVSGDANISSFIWDNTVPGLNCYPCFDPVATPTVTSDYVIVATNTNGCVARDTVTITVNNVTSDIFPDTIPICKDEVETLILPATMSDVSWTSSLALTQATGLTTDVTASSSAYVEVSYVKDFCTINEMVYIHVWDPQDVDAGNDELICLGQEVVLSTNYPGIIEWREGSQTATPIVGVRVSPTIDTRYYLTVTHHGCDATDSLDVVIDLPSITVSQDTTICLGESTPLMVTGDANINSFIWDSSVPGLSCYPCIDPVATPDTTRSYVVVATNTNGCTTSDTVVVTINDSIPNFLADTIDVCLGTDVDFDLPTTGVTNATWTTTLNITTSNGDLSATVTASDTNFVDVSYDWNTCTYTERIIIRPWDPSTVEAGDDQLVCVAQQVVLPLSPYGTTIWRAGSATAAPLASNIINPTVATTYYMEVSYNGCTGNDFVFIDIDRPMIDATGDQTICIGDTIPLTVTGDAGNTYEWTQTFGLDDPSSATPMASPNSDVTYVVVGTNLNGCTDSDTLTITVNDPNSDILEDSLEICLGRDGEIIIDPLAGTTNINWSTNIAGAALSCTDCDTLTFTASDTGTITLTYEYQACTFTETQYIATWDPATVEAGDDQLICLGDTIPLNTNYDGIVEWREGSLTSPALFVPEAHPSVDTWYYLSITKFNCTGVDSIYVRLNQPVLEVDQPEPICVGTTIPLYVRGVADPAVTFVWDQNQPGLSGCTDCPSPQATPPFTSTYTVYGTNAFGCTDTADITVTVHQDTIQLLPTENDTIYACINQPLDLLLDIVKYPGVDTSSIFWATNIPIDCQCHHPRLSVNQSGPLTLNYKYKSCFKSETVYIVAWDPSTVDAGEDLTICEGEEIQLDRNYPGNVEWYFESMTSASLTGSSNAPTQSGKYYLRVDNAACTAIDSMNVSVLPSANISGSSYPICEGDSIQVDVIGSADSVLFNNAQSLSDPRSFNPYASPTITTVYTVIGHSNGCAPDTATIEVVVNENPMVEMKLPAEFIEGDQIRLQADVNVRDNLSYIWSPGDMIDCTSCQLPLFTPTESTTVTLTVTNDDTGCMATDTASIVQKYVCSDNSINMATAFSPNNDGINDHVKPVSLNEITDFKVFNRWGELVYQSDASGLGWDGIYNGTPLKRGVYVWIAEGVCRFDGRPLTGKGDFMLVR